MKVLESVVSGEGLLSGSEVTVFLLCPQMAEGIRELSGVSFIRVLIPFMRALLSRPGHLPKTPPSNTITRGIGFNIRIRGTQTFSL